MKRVSFFTTALLAVALASCGLTDVQPSSSTNANLTLPSSGNTSTSTWSSSGSTSTSSASASSNFDFLSTTQTLLSGYKAVFGKDAVESLKSVLPGKAGTAVGLLDKTNTYINSLTKDELEMFKQIISNSVSNEKLWALVTASKGSTATTSATGSTATTSGTNSFLTNAAALQLATNLMGKQEPQQAQNALSYYNPNAADSTQKSVYENLTNALGSFFKK